MQKNLVLQIALGVFLGALGALSVMEVWHSYKDNQASAPQAVKEQDAAARGGPSTESNTPVGPDTGPALSRPVAPPAPDADNADDNADAEEDEDVEEMDDTGDDSEPPPQ